jgi:hypothetical protein
MNHLIDAATRISTPLGLVGLIAALLFLVSREILSRNVFPKLTQSFSAALLTLSINRLFLLAFASLLLAIVVFATPTLKAEPPLRIQAILQLGVPFSFGADGVHAHYYDNTNGPQFALVLPDGSVIRGLATENFRYDFVDREHKFTFLITSVNDRFLRVTLEER